MSKNTKGKKKTKNKVIDLVAQRIPKFRRY